MEFRTLLVRDNARERRHFVTCYLIIAVSNTFERLKSGAIRNAGPARLCHAS